MHYMHTIIAQRLYLRLLDALVELHDTHTHIGTSMPVSRCLVALSYNINFLPKHAWHDARRVNTQS